MLLTLVPAPVLLTLVLVLLTALVMHRQRLVLVAPPWQNVATAFVSRVAHWVVDMSEVAVAKGVL